MKNKLLMNGLQCTECAPGWSGTAPLASGRNAAEEPCKEQSTQASELNLALRLQSEGSSRLSCAALHAKLNVVPPRIRDRGRAKAECSDKG